MLEGQADFIFKTNVDALTAPTELLFDRSWIKNTFLVGKDVSGTYSKWLNRNRFYSTADAKFGSTCIGMSMAVNPKFQFTRFADIRRPGLVSYRDPNNMRKTGVPGYTTKTGGHPFGLGMGRFYSEMIDDNQQRIFLRFGEPQYLGMLFWIGKSFDIHKAILYRRGLITSVIIQLVDLTTKWWSIARHPWIAGGVVLLSNFLGSGRFISVRDNMYTYWNVAETILNKMYLKRTGAPFDMSFMNSAPPAGRVGQELKISREFVSNFNKQIPGLIDPETGRISIWTAALRSASVYNQLMIDDSKNVSLGIEDDYIDTFNLGVNRIDRLLTNKQMDPSIFTKWILKWAYAKGMGSMKESEGNSFRDAIDSIKGFFAGGEVRAVADEEDIPYSPAINPRNLGPNQEPLLVDPSAMDTSFSPDVVDQNNLTNPSMTSTWNKIKEYAVTSAMEGASFAVFEVESTGSVGESFSNTAESNPIETLFNSISAQVRTAMNTLTAFTDIPVVGDAAKLAGDMAAVTAKNVSFGLANPLLALLYGTSISLPKMWSGSSAALPRANYRMRLMSPYGNPYSQLFSMHLPLAMIMAGAFPRTTGSDSYSAPFMCQLYDRGRVNIPYGMISEFNVTRGVDNLVFTRAGHPNAIDVDFTVLDLNEVMSVDATPSGVLTRTLKAINEFDMTDTALDNYVSTITGLDVYQMFYIKPRWRYKLAEKYITIKSSFTDRAAQGAFLANINPLSGILGMLGSGDPNLIQDMRGL